MIVYPKPPKTNSISSQWGNRFREESKTEKSITWYFPDYLIDMNKEKKSRVYNLLQKLESLWSCNNLSTTIFKK